jgi:hypothetical protein
MIHGGQEKHMRLVLSSLLVCAAWPVAAQPDLMQCAAIDSALQRLDCYDRLARDAMPSESAAQKSDVGAPVKPQPSPEPVREPEPLLAEPSDRTSQRAPAADSAGDTSPIVAHPDSSQPVSEGFGLPQRRQASAELESITAHIESARRAPLGQHILTLSNGQVWMENEPGRRRIAAGQDVVIRKHRWHYEMELPSQPNVAVRRID